MSFPPGTEMFQFPGFASAAYGFSGGSPIAGRGCPIRRSSDQSLLAAPQGLSQRATSFIASWRQGIHQMPLLSSTPTSDNRSRMPADATAVGGRRFQRLPTKLGLPPAILAGGPHTHANDVLARRRKTNKKGKDVDLPMPTTGHARLAPVAPPQRASRHHLTMSKEHARSGRPKRAVPGERGHVGCKRPGPCPGHEDHRLQQGAGRSWWAWADLNGRPHAYQACALTS